MLESTFERATESSRQTQSKRVNFFRSFLTKRRNTSFFINSLH